MRGVALIALLLAAGASEKKQKPDFTARLSALPEREVVLTVEIKKPHPGWDCPATAIAWGDGSREIIEHPWHTLCGDDAPESQAFTKRHRYSKGMHIHLLEQHSPITVTVWLVQGGKVQMREARAFVRG